MCRMCFLPLMRRVLFGQGYIWTEQDAWLGV